MNHSSILISAPNRFFENTYEFILERRCYSFAGCKAQYNGLRG
jgi:hypothetical protein